MDATDAESLRQWQAAQLADDEPPIAAPLHPLDPETVVALLMLICAPSEAGSVLWKTAVKRLAMLSHAILPDIGNQSLEKLAQQHTGAGIPTTRAALSVINCQLYDACGIRRTEKTDSNRESYRIRACKVWQKKSNRYATAAPNQ